MAGCICIPSFDSARQMCSALHCYDLMEQKIFVCCMSVNDRSAVMIVIWRQRFERDWSHSSSVSLIEYLVPSPDRMKSTDWWVETGVCLKIIVTFFLCGYLHPSRWTGLMTIHGNSDTRKPSPAVLGSKHRWGLNHKASSWWLIAL